MNHRRSPEGYHSSNGPREWERRRQQRGFDLASGHRSGARCPARIGLLLAAVTALTGAVVTPDASREPTDADVDVARQLVLDRINQERNDFGHQPLIRDALLERVGDATAQAMLEDGLIGHVGRDGVPPFLRWALAGGGGFHKENAGSLETTGSLLGDRIGDVLVALTDGMLAEKPPDDGHRRALLDPWATSLGVGVAIRSGRVVMNHQLAVHLAETWVPPPAVALPGSTLQVAGRLPPTWQVVGLQIRRDGLPRLRSRSETPLVTEVHYPPQVAMLPVRRGPTAGRTVSVDNHNNFTASWQAGNEPGVEIALLWAHPRGSTVGATPVALAATVVQEEELLAPHLARWLALRGQPPPEDRR